MERPIGGFFGLELPRGLGGFRRLWGAEDIRWAFCNGRSAFAALLGAANVGAVWLPAFICCEFAAVVPPERLRFYPVDTQLSPVVPFLERNARSGDMVLGVDFFGQAPSRDFRDYATQHADIVFVEDCAHAVDTGLPPWGDWRIFSPRKLVGVPDGGLLAPCSAKARETDVAASEQGELAIDIAAPQLLRFEDESESSNEVWYASNQAKEAKLPLSNRRISRLAWELLALLDVDSICSIRRRNFRMLASALPQWDFLRAEPSQFVPMAFPVRLPAGSRVRVREHLHRHRIFAAVHWAALPSPAAEFPYEHELAATLLSLPCDHRYSEADMERVIDVFLKAVSQ